MHSQFTFTSGFVEIYNEDDKMLTFPFAVKFREINDAIKWKVSENGKGKKEAEEISCVVSKHQ